MITTKFSFQLSTIFKNSPLAKWRTVGRKHLNVLLVDSWVGTELILEHDGKAALLIGVRTSFHHVALPKTLQLWKSRQVKIHLLSFFPQDTVYQC